VYYIHVETPVETLHLLCP